MSGEHQVLLITWLIASLQWSMVVAELSYGGASLSQTQVDWSELRKGWLEHVFIKTLSAFDCTQPQNGVMVHLSAQQWPEAYSQDSVGVPSRQVSDCAVVTQPKPRLNPIEFWWRPKDGSSQMLLIQSDRVWEDLPGRMWLPKFSCPKLVETYPTVACNNVGTRYNEPEL